MRRTFFSPYIRSWKRLWADRLQGRIKMSHIMADPSTVVSEQYTLFACFFFYRVLYGKTFRRYRSMFSFYMPLIYIGTSQN